MPTLEEVVDEEIKVVGVSPGKERTEDDSSQDNEQRSDAENSQGTTVVKAPTGPFDPTLWIDLTGKGVCRAVYPVSYGSQKKRIKLVCSRTNCQFHRNATQRLEARYYV